VRLRELELLFEKAKGRSLKTPALQAYRLSRPVRPETVPSRSRAAAPNRAAFTYRHSPIGIHLSAFTYRHSPIGIHLSTVRRQFQLVISMDMKRR